MRVRKFMGGYESPTGKLFEFVMAECECCNIEGILEGTLTKTTSLMGTNKVYTMRPPTIYYKQDEDGFQYDPVCGWCVDSQDDSEVKEVKPQP